MDDQETNDAVETDEPLYRFSWRRFAVVGTALLTLPIWAPWVKEHVAMDQMLLAIPFFVILVLSIVYVSFAFPTKSIRRKRKGKK